MANRVRDPQREQFWRERLARFHASGLSIRAFCRQEQLPEPRFYAWRRTIAERDGKPLRTGKPSTARKRRLRRTAPAFLPVVMRPGPLALRGLGMSLEEKGDILL